MIRLRALGVLPQVSISITSIGEKVKASNLLTTEADITYFFTKNIAVELTAAVTRHKISTRGTSVENVPSVSV